MLYREVSVHKNPWVVPSICFEWLAPQILSYRFAVDGILQSWDAGVCYRSKYFSLVWLEPTGKGWNGQLIIMLNIKRSKSYSTQSQRCPWNRSWRSRENVHVIYEALKILLHYPCHQDCNENGKWHQLNPFSLQSLDCNLVFSPQENAKWDFKQKRGQRSMENKEANRNWKVKEK